MKVGRVCTAVDLCIGIFVDLRKFSMNVFRMPCKEERLMIPQVCYSLRVVIPAKCRVYQAHRTLKVKAYCVYMIQI
jgi:hypothetical protein